MHPLLPLYIVGVDILEVHEVGHYPSSPLPAVSSQACSLSLGWAGSDEGAGVWGCVWAALYPVYPAGLAAQLFTSPVGSLPVQMLL